MRRRAAQELSELVRRGESTPRGLFELANSIRLDTESFDLVKALTTLLKHDRSWLDGDLRGLDGYPAIVTYCAISRSGISRSNFTAALRDKVEGNAPPSNPVLAARLALANLGTEREAAAKLVADNLARGSPG